MKSTRAEQDLDKFKKPLWEHLEELVVRFRRSALWLVLGFGVAYHFAADIVEFIKLPLFQVAATNPQLPAPKLITTVPFEIFWSYMRISVFGAFLIILPLLGIEIAGFVGPGLKKKEKRRILILTLSIFVVFCLGILAGYRFVLPAVLEAILRFGMTAGEPFWTLSAFINTSLGILIVTAVLFELPVIMIHLTAWGWVESATWSKGRRIAIVLNAFVSAILSPPDAMSMLLMMVPVHLLYESGLVLSYLAAWFRRRSL